MAIARLPEVTQADLAELEHDQVRQLANAHYAEDTTGKAPSYFRYGSEADTSEVRREHGRSALCSLRRLVHGLAILLVSMSYQRCAEPEERRQDAKLQVRRPR